ncbi:MAG: rod shape-determining protein RodA [Muribaculaceae bacterium]
MELRNTNRRSVFHDVDLFTIIIYAILVIAGVFSIYAAGYDYDNAGIFAFSEFSGKQIMWIGISAVISLVILLVDRRIYETYAYPLYVLLLFILLMTVFIAPDIKGSHSWLVLGPISLQPAEFAKFATALALAKLFSEYNFVLNARFSNYLRALLIMFLPMIIILAQNETGSALVFMSLFLVLYREGMSGLVLFAAIFAVVIFVVTVKYTETIVLGIPVGEFVIFVMIQVLLVFMLAVYSKRDLAARNVALGFIICGIIAAILSALDIAIPGTVYFLSTIAIALLYVLFELLKTRIQSLIVTVFTIVLSVTFLFSVNYVFTSVLQPHQQLRVKVALGIEEDLRAAGYNVNQSKIAIGSGGFWGKGYLKGTQTKLKYVPEQHTDFIFCTIGEEQGFVGTVTVLSLFLILILRILSIAERQPSTFGRVYAYCVASYFILHFCINIGMVIGLCPVIGIPLPFFSYGGSSLLGFTILLFILLRIDAGRREYH